MDLLKIFEQIKNSQFTRILLVSFLILILQIPTAMVQGIISERQGLRSEVISDITTSWGQQQAIIGPRLSVPYIKRFQTDKGVQSEVQYGVFLPTTLNVTSKMDSEVRYRGIFEVPVYQTILDLKGGFTKPDLTSWGVRPEDILWDRAELSLQISDAHAIQNQANLTWNQAKLAFAPGLGKYGGSNSPGIHSVLKGSMTGDRYNFAIPLNLNGSEKLTLAPFGEITQFTLTSDWANPSFQGVWLPNERTVNADGFSAKWSIPSLGRNYPQQWNTETPVGPETIQSSLFGVDLISPVDNYRMAERSIKYNFLFLLLTFATFWLFETVAKLRVHPLQYLMVGVAMSLFYLLQLALSEHVGFQVAYSVASIAVVGMITAYSVAVLKARKRGVVVGAVQVALYAYLYVVLVNQDYSLLIGSLGLFGFLAVIMYFTRQMNWFTPDSPEPDAIAPATPTDS